MNIVEEKNRLVLLDNGTQVGEMTWSQAGETLMIIDHTEVSPAYQGKGYAHDLVKAGVEKARREHLKIIPLCPFAAKEFKTNQSYRDVLN